MKLIVAFFTIFLVVKMGMCQVAVKGIVITPKRVSTFAMRANPTNDPEILAKIDRFSDLLVEGCKLLNQNNPKMALLKFEEAEKALPYARALVTRFIADARYRQGDLRGATQAFREAIQVNSDQSVSGSESKNPFLLLVFSQLLFENNEKEESKIVYNQCLQYTDEGIAKYLIPEKKQKDIEYNIRMMLACYSERVSDDDDCLFHLEKAMKIYSNIPESRIFYARHLLGARRFTEAKASFQAVVKMKDKKLAEEAKRSLSGLLIY